MTLADHVRAVEQAVPDAKKGLPDEVFAMVTRLTPMVNVDLLIRTEEGFLLTWREDGHFAPGWHIPGGIIRFMETASARLDAVARNELGAALGPRRVLLNVHEFFCPQFSKRNHFISLLYAVELASDVTAPRCRDLDFPSPGEYAFFKEAPENLLSPHEVYRKFLAF